MPPLGFNVERAGDGSYEALTLGPGDIDGDGYNDAIVTLREGDISAVNSGAVYIYAGGPEGIGVEPARVIVLEGRRSSGPQRGRERPERRRPRRPPRRRRWRGHRRDRYRRRVRLHGR